MLNKNVCPKCGQLYDLNLAACPVCNTPAQVLPQNEQPVQRRRLTEVERRQRQQDQKREAAESRKREREARRAADAEEERLLEEEEERLWTERQRKKLEKRGLSEEEIDRRLNGGSNPKEERLDDAPSYDRGRVPGAFSWVSILLLLLALAIGGSFLLWRAGIVKLPIYDELKSRLAGAPQETVCESISLTDETIAFTEAGQTHSLEYKLLPEGCTQSVSFTTSDESVAMVGELGIVTAVGPGSAVITAKCGDSMASCTVTCSFAEPTEEPTEEIDLSDGIVLNLTDITFKEAGENTYLSVTNLPVGVEVFWASSNEEVATVDENGHVVAVGKGTCYITAVVNDYTESCIVRCNFGD